MNELLNTISELHHDHDAPSKLIHSLSHQLRGRYGECAIALMTSSEKACASITISLFCDHTGKVCIEEQNILKQESYYKHFSGGFLTSFLNEIEPIKYIGKKYGINSLFDDFFIDYIDAVTLPIFHQGDVSRWLVILFPNSEQIINVDIERTLLVSTLVFNFIESVQKSIKLKQANDWIAGELKSVANIKQQLLPQGELVFDELNTAVFYEPYELSGGDYYDIARLTQFLEPDVEDSNTVSSNELFGVIVADASGHGTASAVEIAMFDAILRTYDPDVNQGPAGVFNYANKYLFTRLIRNGFITAFVSSYQTETHILSYANAGHPPPIIKRSINNSIEILTENIGIPLGVSQDNQWLSANIEINKDDVLVVYTDGITELKSPNGDFFGEQALIEVIKESENTPEKILKNIKLALKDHQGEKKNSDDLTLIIIQPRD